VAQLEEKGKSIIPTVMAPEFGCEENVVEQIEVVDPKSHMCIWKKKSRPF